VGIVALTLAAASVCSAGCTGRPATSWSPARVVLADGRVVDCDHESEPDLFWARGAGGGQFGVVTALTFVKPTAVLDHQAGILPDDATVVLARWNGLRRG
jgi:FAD/FMN-containing dehydrogenase